MTTDQQRQEATRRIWQAASDKIRQVTNDGPIMFEHAATVEIINTEAMSAISKMLWDDDPQSVKTTIDAFVARDFTKE